MPEPKKLQVGVIIGRFQVHNLHAGHKSLIRNVKKRSEAVIILVGSTPSVNLTKRQPLNYETRRAMLVKEGAYVFPILDNPTNEGWSEKVDELLEKQFVGSNPEFTLYGSRDSFIPFYKGKHKVFEFEPVSDARGTAMREKIKDEVKDSADFRRGIIYASQHRYPTMFCTVDIAIIDNYDKSHWKILLGRKKNDPAGKWRLPGGFLDPTKDKTFEDAAKREAGEEVTGIKLGPMLHIGSLLVDDWRYRKEDDKIMTTIFVSKFSGGIPVAGDDLSEVQWFECKTLTDSDLVNEHVPIWHKARDEMYWKLLPPYEIKENN